MRARLWCSSPKQETNEYRGPTTDFLHCSACYLAGVEQAINKPSLHFVPQETYEYRDPITDFLHCLFVDFDFEGAQDKLAQCEEVGVSLFLNF